MDGITENKTKEKNRFVKMIEKINWKKVLEYSLPALITVFIFMLGMIIKQCYPFGKNEIAYIDYNEQFVTFYTKLWDCFHGKANVFVDWNLCAGASNVTYFVVLAFFSPLNWVIALFPRDTIMYTLGFLFIFKLALMATTAYICFKHFFKNVNKWVLLLFSLIWTLSGWTLIHFTNSQWYEIIILFPLLIISAEKLVKEGKIFWFVINLSIMLIFSYYLTYMVLVATVVCGTLYVILIAENKKKVTASLFYAIVISILISFVSFIPSCFTSLQAHRFTYDGIEKAGGLFASFYSKISVLIMYALPIVFFMRLMFTYKKDKKNVLFFMLSVIICSIGLIIEPINLMWHTGSYFSWPFRYGFIIIMQFIFASLYYINKYMSGEALAENETNQKTNAIIIVSATASFIISMAFIIFKSVIGSKVHEYKNLNGVLFLPTLLIFIFSYVLIELLLRVKDKRLKLGNMCGGILIFAFCIIQMACLTTGYVGFDRVNETPRITNALKIDTTELDHAYKLKDRESNYNLNFAQLCNFPSLQSWIPISSENQWSGYNKLGVNTYSTTLLSSGGTILTDVLLGNKYILSKEELNSTYFTKIKSFSFMDSRVEKDDNNKDKLIEFETTAFIYELNFNFNQVFTTNENLAELFKDQKSVNYFNNQNVLFKTLYKTDKNIMENVDYVIEENKDCYTIKITAPNNKVLYLSTDIQLITKSDDQEEIKIRSGISEISFLNNKEVVIELVKEDNEKLTSLEDIKEHVMFGVFDIELFATEHNKIAQNNSKIVQDGTNLKVTINNTENHKYAFIPYTVLKNIKGVNNGKETKVLSGIDTFMFVELVEGENNITLTYEPQYLKLCLIVTIVAIVMFIVFAILNKKFDLISKKYIIWPGFVGGCIILAVVGFLVYLKPLFSFFQLLFTV